MDAARGDRRGAHDAGGAGPRGRPASPARRVRTTWLCRDKPSMKEALRQAGVPTAASARPSTRRTRPGRSPSATATRSSSSRATGAGAQGTVRVDNDTELARRWPGSARDGATLDRHRGVRRGPRGLLRHHRHRRPGRPRLGHALLPQRPRGDAAPLDLAAVHHHQPHRPTPPFYAEVREHGRAGHRGARHRDVGHPHGVVLRPEGPEVLRDRLPPAGRRRVGPLLRAPTTSTSTASGRTSSSTARPSSPMRRTYSAGHRRAAPRPRRVGSRATAASTRSRRGTASGSSTAHFPPDGHRHPAGRGRLHGQRLGPDAPPRLRHRCAACSTTSGRTIHVHAG